MNFRPFVTWSAAAFFAISLLLHDIGLIVLLGISLASLYLWMRSRNAETLVAPSWSTDDRFLSIVFTAPFFFKLIASLWSSQPHFGLENAGWHLALVLWPALAYFFLRYRDAIKWARIVDVISIVLIISATWALSSSLNWVNSSPVNLRWGHLNTGVYAQLATVSVFWTLLAATQAKASGKERLWFGIATLAGIWLVLWSHRRIELLAVISGVGLIIYWRTARQVAWWKILGLATALGLVLGFALWQWVPKFALGIHEIQRFFDPSTAASVKLGSVDTRLEIYGRAWKAFLDKPWFGFGSGVRPYLLAQYAVVFDGPVSQFNHRHFHSMWVEMLIEGGLLWFIPATLALLRAAWLMVIKNFNAAPEISLAIAALWFAYGMEGLSSAALTYGAPTAWWALSTALLWSLKRRAIEVHALQNP